MCLRLLLYLAQGLLLLLLLLLYLGQLLLLLLPQQLGFLLLPLRLVERLALVADLVAAFSGLREILVVRIAAKGGIAAAAAASRSSAVRALYAVSSAVRALRGVRNVLVARLLGRAAGLKASVTPGVDTSRESSLRSFVRGTGAGYLQWFTALGQQDSGHLSYATTLSPWLKAIGRFHC